MRGPSKFVSPVEVFEQRRREGTQLILKDCRDTRVTRKNLNQLLAMACEISVSIGEPIVTVPNMDNCGFWVPSADFQPETTPTANDAMRLHALSVKWD